MMAWIFVAGLFIGALVGIAVGVFIEFDWKAYYQYKRDVVEMGMKYEKEMRNE